MEYIINYAKDIVLVLLFFSFVKMFLSNKNYMKYIDVVLGFLLILVLLQPISKIINLEIIDFSITEEKKVNVDEYIALGENYVNTISDETIKNQVEELLENYDYQVLDISISINEEYKLENINIILKEKEVSNIKIDPITIEGDGVVVESLEILEIKNLIKDFYNLSLSHINVYIK